MCDNVVFVNELDDVIGDGFENFIVCCVFKCVVYCFEVVEI